MKTTTEKQLQQELIFAAYVELDKVEAFTTFKKMIKAYEEQHNDLEFKRELENQLAEKKAIEEMIMDSLNKEKMEFISKMIAAYEQKYGTFQTDKFMTSILRRAQVTLL
jgi:hypothetical protein